MTKVPLFSEKLRVLFSRLAKWPKCVENFTQISTQSFAVINLRLIKSDLQALKESKKYQLALLTLAH